MKFLYVYPERTGPAGSMLDAGPIAEVAAAVEAAGFDGIAFTEHPAPGAAWLSAGGHQTLDPFVALGAASAATSRITLLTYLTVVPYRNPLLLAKAAATLDLVSSGRAVLGAGTGYLKGEFRGLGVDMDERNALFDEALEVFPLHWSGEPFSFEGRHFEARDVIARPSPGRPVPLWLGGNSIQTLRRVAARAQGWIPLIVPAEAVVTVRSPNLVTVEDLAARIATLRELAGERAPELEIVPPYHDRSLCAPATDATRHRDAFDALEAAGATGVVVNGPPSASTAETLAFLDAFGSTYLT
jgi:probable F420-dependent oxidoreductase